MRPPGWLNTDDGQVWLAFLRGKSLIDKIVERNLQAAFDLSAAEFEILTRLATASGRRMRMGVLSDVLLSPKTRLNYQVGQLAKRGLVIRVPDERDGRGMHAVLTPSGTDLFVQAARVQIATITRYVLDPLSALQREQFRGIMTAIGDAVEPDL